MQHGDPDFRLINAGPVGDARLWAGSRTEVGVTANRVPRRRELPVREDLTRIIVDKSVS